MASEQPETETAAAVAQKEAARQAVVLAFGIAGALAMIPVYKRIARVQAEQLRSMLPHDPVMREVEQEQARAKAAAAAVRARVRRWHRAAALLWPLSSSAALWALRRAESASKQPAGDGA